jgi:hypothetical protein
MMMTASDDYRTAPTIVVEPLLQVVGVGGGGSNAVNRMLSSQLQGVELMVMNTDAQVKPLHFLNHDRHDDGHAVAVLVSNKMLLGTSKEYTSSCSHTPK